MRRPIQPTGARRSDSKRRGRLQRRSTPRVSRSPGSDATSTRCADRAQRRSGRGRGPAERGMSRLHQSGCALYSGRSGARHHGVPARPRGRNPHRRSRLPGKALYQSRGRLLHVHRAMREEGVPAAEKAIEIDRGLDQREHLAVPLIVLAQIHQCHDAPELALRYYNEALKVARETGEPQLLFPCYDGLATLSLDRDEMEEAERYFGLAQDLCARHGLDPKRSSCCLFSISREGEDGHAGSTRPPLSRVTCAQCRARRDHPARQDRAQ